jgi:hypothetical protein
VPAPSTQTRVDDMPNVIHCEKRLLQIGRVKDRGIRLGYMSDADACCKDIDQGEYAFVKKGK